MVGGLADWFAVTALFRRPLGLPIPHTALIPQRKAQLGEQPRRLRHRELLDPGHTSSSGCARRDPSPRSPVGLATREVAERISHELAVGAAAAVAAPDEADVTAPPSTWPPCTRLAVP